MNQSINLRSITFLSAALITLLGYNFMSAQVWTQAPANPPANNTAAPINVGPTTQNKAGVLGVNGLAVFGQSTFTGWPAINAQGESPTMKYTDTTPGQRDFWTHTNNNTFWVIADRNDNGNWDAELPAPMQMFAGTTTAGDYVRFANQVRANQYCDANGGNCFSPVTGVASKQWVNYAGASSRNFVTVYQNDTGSDLPLSFRLTNNVADNGMHIFSRSNVPGSQWVSRGAALDVAGTVYSFTLPTGHFYALDTANQGLTACVGRTGADRPAGCNTWVSEDTNSRVGWYEYRVPEPGYVPTSPLVVQ